MSKESSGSVTKDILIGLLVTIIGGVSVAWFIKEGERFQSNPTSSTNLSVAITNNDCTSQDFFVDGEKIVSAMTPNSSRAFKTIKGEHWVYACTSGSENCVDPELVNWKSPATYEIKRSNSCPITITLINTGCFAQDIYLDGTLIFAPIQPGETLTFDTTPGTHQLEACATGTDSCGEIITFEWSVPSTVNITRSDLCPITITVVSMGCSAQDIYLDGALIFAPIQPGETLTFDTPPGTHQLKACATGTDSCGEIKTFEWSVPSTVNITRSDSCP